MSNYVDFEKEVSKRLKENISDVREEIKNADMQYKIENYSKKYKIQKNYIEQLIIDDINFASNFAKDPGKQSIHEKISSEYLSNLDIIKDNGRFIDLPTRGKEAKYVTSYGVKNENLDDVKSIDFQIEVLDQKIYASCKHTKGEGGAQDNQYADVKNFVRVASDMIRRGYCQENEHFICIVDGSYYDKKSRINELEQISIQSIPVMPTNGVNNYLIDLMKSKLEEEEKNEKDT